MPAPRKSRLHGIQQPPELFTTNRRADVGFPRRRRLLSSQNTQVIRIDTEKSVICPWSVVRRPLSVVYTKIFKYCSNFLLSTIFLAAVYPSLIVVACPDT